MKVNPDYMPGGINQTDVPTPRNRQSVGPVMPPGTETIFRHNYQAPDPGQIHIPNPGLRTRPATRFHQIHGNPLWYWQDNELSGEVVRFGVHTGPYEDRPYPPSFTTGRVAVARRLPVSQLEQTA
ncbi:MAG TPA: hypothetical protein VHI52_04085 [Verrucomicrobiae bacterium]|nr:hypothetical protein [Verrucomicrobiae bacterium]